MILHSGFAMPTIVDVAKKAGVSISTASYVMSGVRPISEETKERVRRAMDELGYRPQLHARALATKRSRIIALLLPPTRRGIGETELEFVTSAVEAARELDYHLVLWTSEYDDRKEMSHLVRQGLVDGMIVMEVHESDGRVEILKDLQLPFTLIGRNSQTEGCWQDIDFDRTFADATDYLSSLGHRKIAFINQSKEVFAAGYGPAVRAKSAFESAIQAASIQGIHHFCAAAPKDGYSITVKILEATSDITAIQVMNDRALPGVLQAAMAKGLKIPEDLSVMAMVSSSRTAESCLPSITAMEAPGRELARVAVDRLVEAIEGQGLEGSGLLIPCNLVERSSTTHRGGAA